MAVLIEELFRKNRIQLKPGGELDLPEICGICQERITHADRSTENIERVDGKLVHSDCHRRSFGDAADKEGIIRPRVRRG